MQPRNSRDVIVMECRAEAGGAWGRSGRVVFFRERHLLLKAGAGKSEGRNQRDFAQ
jgi:hypothetical protein